jgi:addiction module HigA family antidote
LNKYDLNYNRLAKAIGLSSAMIRLIARDESPISASVAYRLAKFFKTKPEFWLALQLDFDCSQAAEDKKLIKALEKIITVDKATFERKPRAKKQGSAKAPKPAPKGLAAKAAAAKAAASKKTSAKAGAKKAAAKKAPAGKRGRPAGKAAAKGAKIQKKTAGKRVAKATAVKKAPAVKRGRPTAKAAAGKTAAKPAAAVKKAPPAVKPAVEQKPVAVQPAPQPQPQARPAFDFDSIINEPEI